MMHRAFSLLEVLLAIALMSVLFIAVFSLASTLPRAIATSERKEIALNKAQQFISSVAQDADTNVGSIVASSTSIHDGMSTYLATLPTEDNSFLDVTASLSWKSSFGTEQSYALQQRVLSTSSTPASCDPFVSGDWTHPLQTGHYALSATDILSGAPAAQYTLGAITTTPSLVVLAMASTSSRQAPTLLFLTASSTSKPVYVAGFDNASTSRIGFSSTVIAGTTVFAGTAFGSASAATCSDGLSCAQVQVFSMQGALPRRTGAYSLATATAPYAQTTVGATATVRTLSYNEGYLYVGLEKTAHGNEFNIIDVQNASKGIWRAGISVGRSVTGITLRDGYAYLATDDPTRELIIVDVHDPLHPATVSALDLAGASGFGFGVVSTVRNGSIRFGRTYSPNGKEFLTVDAHEPSHPRSVQEIDSGTASNPQSVRSLLTQDWLTFLLLSHRLEFWDTGSTTHLEAYGIPYLLPTSAEAIALSCVHNLLYVAYQLGAESFLDVVRGS